MASQLTQQERRLDRALTSLDGLSVGDGFGERFFAPGNVGLIHRREMPPPYWRYTDDTAMAVSIIEQLRDHGEVIQDDLARRFAAAFRRNPNRGYGPGAIGLLGDLARGVSWREAAYDMFEGEGSMGNGGAMRVAPIGAYFADDLGLVVEQARLSGEVTHAHPEGQAGAIAIAVAAALAARIAEGEIDSDPAALFKEVIERTPEGLTLVNIKQANTLPANTSLEDVVRTLGNGSRVIAIDTVAFCLWCAFHHLDDYAESMWTCVRAGGDMDTTAAIVGGIVACRTRRDGIPGEWRNALEPLPLSTVMNRE